MPDVHEEKPKCPYEQCILPESNNIYFFQAIFLAVCLLSLWSDIRLVTCFGIAAFVLPQTLDLLRLKVNVKSVKILKRCFLGLNILIILFCLAEWAKYFEDLHDRYRVAANALFAAGEEFGKSPVVLVLVLQILIPLGLGCGIPTKLTVAVEKSLGKKENEISLDSEE